MQPEKPEKVEVIDAAKEEEIAIDEDTITRIDEDNPTPFAQYQTVAALLKDLTDTLTIEQHVEYASHFLAAAFPADSIESRMARALLANVYFRHYAARLSTIIVPPKPKLVTLDELRKENGL
jgi:hypothetical protein